MTRHCPDCGFEYGTGYRFTRRDVRDLLLLIPAGIVVVAGFMAGWALLVTLVPD